MNNKTLILLCLIGILSACSQHPKPTHDHASEKTAALKLMQKHLSAVTNKDLESLKETLPPDGTMQLILPGDEIRNTTAEFIQYHQDWFKSPNWTFETEILNSKVGIELALVVVEIIYREPLREGKPYFNRMTVSYVLEHVDGQWYVIKDHASSVEKSTDP